MIALVPSRRGALVLAAAVLTATCGCSIAKIFGVLGEDPIEQVKAEYAGLPGKRLAIVAWVPDSITFTYPHFSRDVMDFASRAIDRGVNSPRKGAWGESKNAAKVTIIPVAKVTEFQAADVGWDQEPPSRIGERLGADFVLWLDITAFNTREPDSPDLFRGELDVGATLYEVSAETPRKDVWRGSVKVRYPEKAKVGLQDSTEERIRQGTLEVFADRLAKFFYDHEEKVK